MTIIEYAGARLASAVAVFLRDRDASALAGLKLVYGEYVEAEQRHADAIAANELQDGDA